MGLFKRVNYKSTKFDGSFIFSDFSYGLYNLDTPRSIGEQLRSLAITGGKNIYTERGALVSQYGYDKKAQLDEDDFPSIVSSDNSLSNSMIIVCKNGKVYVYTTFEGLKKYMTPLVDITNPVVAHNGNILYITSDEGAYIFGGRYHDNDPTDSDFVAILEGRNATCTTDNLLTLKITKEELEYFWIDKQLVYTKDDGTTYIDITVNSIQPLDEDDPDIELYSHRLYLRYDDEAQIDSSIDDPVDLGEMTLKELDNDSSVQNPSFVYVPEDYDSQDSTSPQPVVLRPKLMSVALNRLWVVDYDNTIYYSTVGNMASFEEANGAGYFRGFYQDTSEVLSIEEFFSGILITKQTGMYYIALTTNQYSYSNAMGSVIAVGTTDNYISITKINNITQRYPGDHVIIGNEVIAFDASSGNLVQAAYVNSLNGMQEGSILLHGSELDAQSLGLLSANNRILVYSFQEEALLLYYGTALNKALLINRNLSMFPRELDCSQLTVDMFSRTLINITTDRYIIEDFKRGTVIPDVAPAVEFEQIGLRSNMLLSGTIMEFTELNGVDFQVSTLNAGDSDQHLTPTIAQITTESALPNLVYSDLERNFLPASFADETRWASKKASVTRMAAPLSGRNGLGLALEFQPNVSFCLCSINYPDMSQGE